MAIKFEIVEHIEVLSENDKGWSKELNLVSWNDREPKFDIREWSPEHDKMSKGITLDYEEFLELMTALEGIDIDDYNV